MIISFVCGSEKKVTDNKNNKDTDKKDIVSYDLELKDYQTVIPASQKMDWAFGKNYKQYKPTQDDIEQAEKLLKECFNKEVSGTHNPFFGRKLEQYYRQFVPAETENGNKVIWINCFIHADSEIVKKWKTDILYVADGGNAFLT